MAADLFSTILEDLSKIIHFHLHVDRNNSCLIRMPNDVSIQLELSKRGPFFIIGTDLGNVPVGKYRENVFREALKANNLPLPRYGTFAYSKQKDHLVLFSMLSIQDITAEKIAEHLVPFAEQAYTWKNAIQKGDVPLIDSPSTGQTLKKSRPFGL